MVFGCVVGAPVKSWMADSCSGKVFVWAECWLKDPLPSKWVSEYPCSIYYDEYSSGSRGGGGVRGFKPPFRGFFFACQYMKIPTDLDPKPPLRRILAQNPPFKEFLDPPLEYTHHEWK